MVRRRFLLLLHFVLFKSLVRWRALWDELLELLLQHLVCRYPVRTRVGRIKVNGRFPGCDCKRNALLELALNKVALPSVG